MPNPTVVAANTNSGSFTSGTSVTVTSTGTVGAGQLMVCVLTVGGASAPSALAPPGGWTTFLATTANTASGLIVTAVFYLVAPTPSAAFSGSFSWVTTATSGSWGFFVVNQPGASLVDGSVATSQNASGTKTSPSVTPGTGNVNDTLIGCIIGAVVGADSITKPAAMTSIINIAGTSAQPFFSIASLGLVSSSATGTETWTIPTSRTCLGVSFLIKQGPVYDFENVGGGAGGYEIIKPPSVIQDRNAAIRHTSGFAIYTPPFPEGWQVQPPQPPHPRPERSGNFYGHEDGAEFPLINWKNDGFEAILHQPNHPRVEKFQGTVGGDQGNEFPLIRWQNIGYEIQSYQPQHWRREKWGSLARGDDGTENTYIPPVTTVGWGFDAQAYQPQHLLRPSAAISRIEDGIEYFLVNWYNDGFEATLYQPNHPRPEKWASITPKEDGLPTFVNWLNAGYEIRSPEVKHPLKERFGSMVSKDDGNEFPLINWQNTGWEIQAYQPEHLRIEKAGGIQSKEDGIEFPLINFYPTGFEIQSHQPQHLRFKDLDKGDDGNENVYTAVAPALVNAGYESIVPFFQIRPKRQADQRGADGTERPFINWYNVGYEIQPYQPNHPHPEQRAAGVMPSSNIEKALVAWFNYGWEVQSVQPPHRRTERVGSIMPFPTIEIVYVNWQNIGWPIQPPQPPHPRSERFGALVTKDDGTEFPLINWYVAGWAIQTYQPQHLRFERWGALAHGDDGTESALTPPITVIVLDGYEGIYPQPPVTRQARASAIMPISNIEAVYVFVPLPTAVSAYWNPYIGSATTGHLSVLEANVSGNLTNYNYVAEDGVTPYVAEDGTTNYVIESAP